MVEATKLCPEALQPLAFELLLTHQLKDSVPDARTPRESESRSSGEPAADAAGGTADEASPDQGQEDVSLRDVHAKVRKFLQEGSLGVHELNALYYKDGAQIKPLYDDLRSTAMSESQIRLALLEAFENAVSTGNFEFSGESVREKCKVHKSYDVANFTRNFKNNSALFDGFDSYDAATAIRLSPAGRQRLGLVLAELARSP